MAIQNLGIPPPPHPPKKETNVKELQEWDVLIVRYLGDFIYALEETLDLGPGTVTAAKIAATAYTTLTETANIAIASAAVITFTVTAEHWVRVVTARCTALLWHVHVATVSTSQVEVIATNNTISTSGVTIYIDFLSGA